MFLGVPVFKPNVMRLESTLIMGHLKIMNFPFGTNHEMENLFFLGIPILKHIRVNNHHDKTMCHMQELCH